MKRESIRASCRARQLREGKKKGSETGSRGGGARRQVRVSCKEFFIRELECQAVRFGQYCFRFRLHVLFLPTQTKSRTTSNERRVVTVVLLLPSFELSAPRCTPLWRSGALRAGLGAASDDGRRGRVPVPSPPLIARYVLYLPTISINSSVLFDFPNR